MQEESREGADSGTESERLRIELPIHNYFGHKQNEFTGLLIGALEGKFLVIVAVKSGHTVTMTEA